MEENSGRLSCFRNKHRYVNIVNARKLSRQVLAILLYENYKLECIKSIVGII